MARFLYLLVSIILLTMGCGEKKETHIVVKSSKKQNNIHSNPVKFTYTSVCQMRCNQLSTSSIKSMLTNGKLRTSKTWLDAKPCPFYVVESQDNKQDYYVIIAYCKDVTKIVRVFRKPVNPECAECLNK